MLLELTSNSFAVRSDGGCILLFALRNNNSFRQISSGKVMMSVCATRCHSSFNLDKELQKTFGTDTATSSINPVNLNGKNIAGMLIYI